VPSGRWQLNTFADVVDDGPLEETLLDALGGVLEANLALEALRRALEAERIETLPAEPAALRFFVTGALRRVVVEELGATHFDVLVGPLARQLAEAAGSRRHSSSGTRFKQVGAPQTSPPPPAGRVHHLLVVSLDPRACDELERRVGPGVAVSRAESLFDFAPLLEMGPERGGAVIVDVAVSPIALPVLGRMAHVIPPACPVVVAGVAALDWERFSSLLSTVNIV